jgi:hypothetical protein
MSSNTQDDYQFVAIESCTERSVLLQIKNSDDNSDVFLTKVWHKLSQAVKNSHADDDDSGCPHWTSWKPHEWSKKKIPDRISFVAWDGSVLAGLLNMRTYFPSCRATNQCIMYIEHVANFSGNMQTMLWNRKLKYVGVVLTAFAALKSQEHGYGGAFGLHADDHAVGFWDRMNGEFDLFDVREKGVEGPHQGSKDQFYFESDGSGAIKLLEDYKNA